MPRMRWSVIASLFTVVALGGVTTIATAWILALWPTVEEHIFSSMTLVDPPNRAEGRQIYIEEGVRTGVSWTQYSVSHQSPEYVGPKWGSLTGVDLSPSYWRMLPTDEAGIRLGIRNFESTRPPQWPRWLPSIPRSDSGLVSYGGRAAGWPMLCLRSVSHAAERDSDLVWWWMVAVRPASAYGGVFVRDPADGSIPLLPEPAGFAVNTGFYGAIWLAILTIASKARGELRRRRGMCSRCAYDLRGLAPGIPCPECGDRDSARDGRSGDQTP